MNAAVLTAHPARVAADFARAFRRGQIPRVVHAVADQPVTIHPFGHQDREAAIGIWRIRTHGQRPLIIHDEQRIPDPADHVIEDQVLPCQCGAEILLAAGMRGDSSDD